MKKNASHMEINQSQLGFPVTKNYPWIQDAHEKYSYASCHS